MLCIEGHQLVKGLTVLLQLVGISSRRQLAAVQGVGGRQHSMGSIDLQQDSSTTDMACACAW